MVGHSIRSRRRIIGVCHNDEHSRLRIGATPIRDYTKIAAQPAFNAPEKEQIEPD